MPSIADARAFNTSYNSSPSATTTPPVAVVVGGTAGIGAGIAGALTASFNGDLDVYIIGRNKAAGQAVLDSLPLPPHQDGEASNARRPIRDFIPCDAWLMRDVARTTAELKTTKGVEKINYLVMSPGIMTMQGRTESDEGIDQKLALHYYARWKFAHDLVPLLQKAKDAGEDAKVLTVLSAGIGAGAIDTTDLGLKNKYSVAAAALQAPSYNDALIQSFAQRHPALSFVHAYPGFVTTGLTTSSNSTAIRWAGVLTLGIAGRLFGTSAADCGEYLTYGLFNARAGWSRIDDKGEDIGRKALYTTEEINQALWDHSMKETRSQA